MVWQIRCPPSSPENGPSGRFMWCRYSGLLRWVMETPRTPVTFPPAAQISMKHRHEAPWRPPGSRRGSRSPCSWLRLIGLRHFEITGLPGDARCRRRSPPSPPRKLDKRPTGAAPVNALPCFPSCPRPPPRAVRPEYRVISKRPFSGVSSPSSPSLFYPLRGAAPDRRHGLGQTAVRENEEELGPQATTGNIHAPRPWSAAASIHHRHVERGG